MQDQRRYTPLHYAIEGQPSGPAPTRSAGRPDVEGFPKTELARSQPGDSRLPIVDLLLQHGAPVDPPVHRRTKSPLKLAATFDDADVARLLLERGAKVDGLDSFLVEERCGCPRVAELVREAASARAAGTAAHSEL